MNASGCLCHGSADLMGRLSLGWGFFRGASLTIFVQDGQQHAQSSRSRAKLIKRSCPEPAGVRGAWPSVPRGEGDAFWQSSGFVPLWAARALPRVGGSSLSGPAAPNGDLALPKFGWFLSTCHLLVRSQ